jgi:Protein of unknown function (DUF2523)
MPALLGWLIEICGTLVGQVLLSLGISYLSYEGLDSVITAAKDSFFTSIAGLSPTTVGMLGVLKVDVAVNMLCSALVARLTIAGMTSGKLKKMVLK